MGKLMVAKMVELSVDSMVAKMVDPLAEYLVVSTAES